MFRIQWFSKAKLFYGIFGFAASTFLKIKERLVKKQSAKKNTRTQTETELLKSKQVKSVRHISEDLTIAIVV